eukprot:TRINITY_DN156_c0_g1_i6.p4 TRINITY_DN156_c0_g1~~TRINITY_DN156_c0_g1_i6.p4  ORF type:complete len:116 (+),score=30.98 TRINITY_DN156_c0_g1_i6:158-505(+)
MSFAKIAVATLALLVGAVVSDTCPCNDNPPMPGVTQVQYTCEEQVKFGKCKQEWMQGYCECACGICSYEPVPIESISGPIEEPMAELMEPMEEPAPAPKKAKKSKKSKKNRKQGA